MGLKLMGSVLDLHGLGADTIKMFQRASFVEDVREMAVYWGWSYFIEWFEIWSGPGAELGLRIFTIKIVY